MANGTAYGLTAGLHSLDEREHARWQAKVQAGNCYINRGITGAIVQRQPFGGCKASSFGPGAKAGGPNYVLQLSKVIQTRLPDEREPVNDVVLKLSHRLQGADVLQEKERGLWTAALGSYAFYWNHYFSQDQDPSKILGQDNILRYLPRTDVILRIDNGDSLVEALCGIAAALTCRAPLAVSLAEKWSHLAVFASVVQGFPITFVVETDEELAQRIISKEVMRLRCLHTPPSSVTQACAEAGITLVVAPMLANGRIELLHNLREESLSSDYHRYGYLGDREPSDPKKQQGCCQKGSCSSCS